MGIRSFLVSSCGGDILCTGRRNLRFVHVDDDDDDDQILSCRDCRDCGRDKTEEAHQRKTKSNGGNARTCMDTSTPRQLRLICVLEADNLRATVAFTQPETPRCFLRNNNIVIRPI